MGASLSAFSCKRKSPESSSPDHHEQVQQPKKVKVEEDQSTTVVVDHYQVFLSFRGSDTRHDFTDVLYDRMVGVGVRVFRDDDEIRIGQPINVILKAVENSEICVPILSKSFASSKWCLMEIEKMVELKKKVMPIFYKVSSEDVKLRTDLYKKDMEGHLEKYGKEQVDKWEAALKEIAGIKGMVISQNTSYIEGCTKFINDVLRELPRKDIRCNANHLVGMDKPVDRMMKRLDIGSHDRRYVVIHGMSGIGKTTLANAIFNKLSDKFVNSTCFLEDVRESSYRDLQKRLVKGLVPRSIRQSNLSWDIVKERFYNKKVLIVLDDVEKWEQIEKLVGRSRWFGAGSIIIVTTNNENVLNRGGLDKKEVIRFEMQTLEDEEAFDLFCWHAFRKNNPSVGFESLSREIVGVAEGLPLILTVIGALLYENDEKAVWRDVISRLQKVPVKEVAERLRISYEALEDDQRKIFLDIACLSSIANDSRSAIYMWEACELHPHYGLKALSSLSLIRMKNNSIWMHSQLKYLGKKVVGEESGDSYKRSRIWLHKEAIKVLMSKEGKEKVEALAIEDGVGLTLSNEQFASCGELRFLQLAGANITGDFKNLLPNLRWLSWQYCPAIFSATNLFMKNLVNLDLSWSSINESWGGWKLIQALKHLKVLDLSDCKSLTRTPEFSESNCLERLVLSRCRKLREIHPSIGKLKKLKYLELDNCASLGGLPHDIASLVNLEELQASCGLRRHRTPFKLPNSIGCLKSLSRLSLEGFVISDIPDSIGRLTELKSLNLKTIRGKVLPESLGDLQSLVFLGLTITSECKLPNSLGRLVNLTALYVRGGTNLDELIQSLGSLQELNTLSLEKGIVRKIPAHIGNLKKLEYLYFDGVLEELPTEVVGLTRLRRLRLQKSPISTLPSTFSQLNRLEELDLGINHVLQALPDLPPSLKILRVSSRSLRKISNLSNLVNLTELTLLDAVHQSVFEGGIEKLIKLQKLYLGIATAKMILLQSHLCPLPSLEELILEFEDDSFDGVLLPSTSSSLDHLDITSQGKHGRLMFPKVQNVVFRNCFIKDGFDSLGIQHVGRINILNSCIELLEITCQMKNLRSLGINCCGSFKTLPDLSELKNLDHFYIYNCKEIVDITGLGNLVSLRTFILTDCASLERLENLSKLEILSAISFRDCPKLRTIEGIEGLSLSSLRIEECGSLQNKDELRKRCKKEAFIRMD